MFLSMKKNMYVLKSGDNYIEKYMFEIENGKFVS